MKIVDEVMRPTKAFLLQYKYIIVPGKQMTTDIFTRNVTGSALYLLFGDIPRTRGRQFGDLGLLFAIIIDSADSEAFLRRQERNK